MTRSHATTPLSTSRREPMRPMRLAVIVASNREGRFADVVVDWFAGRVAEHDGFELDVVDLATAGLPAVFPRKATPAVTRFAARIDAADAIAIVVPEYNHSFPAPLKQAIDLLGDEWAYKPVAFISYGGISGGLRAVEQLRLVFAELHAVTVRDTVSFHGARSAFDEAGMPHDTKGPAAAADRLLDQLRWWARVLRDARRADAVAGERATA